MPVEEWLLYWLLKLLIRLLRRLLSRLNHLLDALVLVLIIFLLIKVIDLLITLTAALNGVSGGSLDLGLPALDVALRVPDRLNRRRLLCLDKWLDRPDSEDTRPSQRPFFFFILKRTVTV